MQARRSWSDATRRSTRGSVRRDRRASRATRRARGAGRWLDAAASHAASRGRRHEGVDVARPPRRLGSCAGSGGVLRFAIPGSRLAGHPRGARGRPTRRGRGIGDGHAMNVSRRAGGARADAVGSGGPPARARLLEPDLGGHLGRDLAAVPADGAAPPGAPLLRRRGLELRARGVVLGREEGLYPST